MKTIEQIVYEGSQGKPAYVLVIRKSRVALATLAITMLLSMGAISQKSAIAEEVNCQKFYDMKEGGYQAAQNALKENPSLDGDGDGRACDKIKKPKNIK